MDRSCLTLTIYPYSFWEFIPTYLTFKYYEHTKRGCWVFKSPEKWIAENADAVKTLTRSSDTLKNRLPDNSGYLLNNRIAVKKIKIHHSFLPITISENIVLDLQKNEVLARLTGIYSGYTDPGLRFIKNYNHRVSLPKGCSEYFSARTAFKNMATIEN